MNICFKLAALLQLHFPQYQEWALQPLVPVEEVLVEEVPAVEAPVEEAPVEEAPVVEAPVEEVLVAPAAWTAPSVWASLMVYTHLPPKATSSMSATQAWLISSNVQVAWCLTQIAHAATGVKGLTH